MAVLAAERAVCGRRNIHDQPRLRRPGEVVPGTASRGRHPGDRDQFRECQCGDRRARSGECPAHRRVRGRHLGCRPEQVLVASTGIIGHQLAMDKIEAGIAAGRRRALRRARGLSNGRRVDHDDRHPPQDRLPAPDDRWPRGHAPGDRQGGGHDRPANGHDARLSC